MNRLLRTYTNKFTTKKRIAWLTDMHLEFLNEPGVKTILNTVAEQDIDAILVGGDSGTANTIVAFLNAMEQWFAVPVYFVLGNHDYYDGGIEKVRSQVMQMTSKSKHLFWLPLCNIIKLTAETGLIGHGAWADGGYGDYGASRVMLNDYIHIEEFKGLKKNKRFSKMNQLGNEAAQYVSKMLIKAFKSYKHMVLLTHVPPFKEACWHEGEISNDNYLPHFSCKAVGDVLRTIMLNHPQHRLSVLCGHTHGTGLAQILPNLRVITGGAEYGEPKIQMVFEPNALFEIVAGKNG